MTTPIHTAIQSQPARISAAAQIISNSHPILGTPEEIARNIELGASTDAYFKALGADSLSRKHLQLDTATIGKSRHLAYFTSLTPTQKLKDELTTDGFIKGFFMLTCGMAAFICSLALGRLFPKAFTSFTSLFVKPEFKLANIVVTVGGFLGGVLGHPYFAKPKLIAPTDQDI